VSSELYGISAKRIDGSDATLGEFKGSVLLIVNVASKCGLTPQYAELEKIYETYHGKGFEVLGFPANEFAGQEPGANSEIQQFCETKFGVKFPMFEKIVVKGEGQHPLYRHLISSVRRSSLSRSWNSACLLSSTTQRMASASLRVANSWPRRDASAFSSAITGGGHIVPS